MVKWLHVLIGCKKHHGVGVSLALLISFTPFAPENTPSFADRLPAWSSTSSHETASSLLRHALAAPYDETVYLPFVTRPYEFLPLGSATQVNGPYVCPSFADQDCYDLAVTCTQTLFPINVTLRVGDPPTGVSTIGTIVFFSGFTGTYYWDGTAGVDPTTGRYIYREDGFQITRQLSPQAVIYEGLITTFRENGFRTVQVKWATNWLLSKVNVQEGLANLACRPATIVQWIYDTLHATGSSQAFCAEGHSNGASQLAFSLTHYGLGKYIDLAVFESGPNWIYQDQSCIQDDPLYSDIFLNDSGRNMVDLTIGFHTSGTGPCYAKDANYRALFQHDSLGLGSWQYNLPSTLVAFLFGEMDQTPNPPTTRNSGRRFSDLLVAHDTPLWMRLDLAGSNHAIGTDPIGLQALQDTILNNCVAR